MAALDDRNRATWSRVVDHYAGLEGWVSAGEREAFRRLAPHVRSAPILDIGVGAGRTTSFLRLLTDDYVAVDYTPEMVAAFRRNHPGVEAHQADARDLSAFGAGRFALATFSYNGIDDVGHEDRAGVLAEMRRVVRPGGWVHYSTHNLEGPAFGQAPWHVHRPGALGAARWLLHARHDPGGPARRWRNWWRNRRAARGGPGWAVHPSRAHDFALLMHYSSLAAVLAEVEAAGLVAPTVLAARDGAPVRPGDDVRAVSWFDVVARVPEAGP